MCKTSQQTSIQNGSVMSKLFLAVDGDDVGRKLEYYIITNQLKSLQEFFVNFQLAMKWLENMLVNEYSATIIFNGGDNLLADIYNIPLSVGDIDLIRIKFSTISGNTISIGLGNSPRNAYIALKIAKASGKNRTELVEDL